MVLQHKTTKKKVIIIITAICYLSLAVYLLSTTPGTKQNKTGKPQITLTVPAGLKTSAIYQKKIVEFEKNNPDISVNLIEISGNYYQKVLVMIAGNVAPDLMWMGQSFSEFADRGVFHDISDKVKRSGINLKSYYPEILKLYKRQGKLYSLPFGVDTNFIVYNRKLFREAGLSDPRDDWDFNDFLDKAEKLTRRDSRGKIICYGFRGGLPPEVFGASPFDPATKKITCDRPEMIQYFQTNLDLMNKYKVCPNAEEQLNMNADNLGLFRQEKVAMMLMYTMRLERAFESLDKMDWGITLTPKVKNNGQWASSQALCIYRNTKNFDAAWQLMRSFQDEDFQEAMSCRMIPALKRVAEKTFKRTENRPYNFEVMKKVTMYLTPMPRVPHLQELYAVFIRFSGKIFSQLVTPSEGMKLCEEDMRKRMKKFAKYHSK